MLFLLQVPHATVFFSDVCDSAVYVCSLLPTELKRALNALPDDIERHKSFSDRITRAITKAFIATGRLMRVRVSECVGEC